MSAPKNPLDVIREVVFSYTGPLQQRSWPAIDCADYLAVFSQEETGGRALVGQGEAQGEGRAVKAAELALADLKRQLHEERAQTPDPLDPLAAVASR